MFTIKHIIYFLVMAIALVSALPVELEERALGRVITNGGNNPKSAKGKLRQKHETAIVKAHAKKEPNHPAVAHGNIATVRQSLHISPNGGPAHITVDYKKPNKQSGGWSHVSTLHLDAHGNRLRRREVEDIDELD